jgi:tRNA threonylcarbamoyladenosine biosynthesis protein TsaB
MIQLAIECSALAGSVAILDRQEVIACVELPPQIGSVQSLAPAIAKLMHTVVQPSEKKIEWISVTSGPGSFTGLRGGLATAKMLAWAWGIPIVPVDTLQVIAEQAVHHALLTNNRAEGVVVPVINAFRKQVFTAAWHFACGQPTRRLTSTQVIDANAWQAAPLAAQSTASHRLDNGTALEQQSVLVAGPGLRSYHPAASSAVNVANEADWEPTAAWVGRLGWFGYQAGQRVTAQQLVPNYVRRSAAEEAIGR